MTWSRRNCADNYNIISLLSPDLTSQLTRLVHLPEEAALVLRQAELDEMVGWEDWAGQLTTPLSLPSLEAGDSQDTIARLKHHNTQASISFRVVHSHWSRFRDTWL